MASLLAAGTACARNTDPAPSLTDRIGAEIGEMNGAQAEADRRADAWRRALRDPSLAFRDASARSVRVLQFLQSGANPRATNRIGTFQVYLPSGAQLGIENSDAKGRLDDIDAWLRAHRVPIDRSRTSPQRS
jgi:hypothetical protein